MDLLSIAAETGSIEEWIDPPSAYGWPRLFRPRPTKAISKTKTIMEMKEITDLQVRAASMAAKAIMEAAKPGAENRTIMQE